MENVFQQKLDREAQRFAEKVSQAAETRAEQEFLTSEPRPDRRDAVAVDIYYGRLEAARQRARQATYSIALQEYEERENRTGDLWRETLAEFSDQIKSDVIV